MRNWQQRKRRRARIEIIPMIDVMMFLLVFFVLISTNVLPALGLKVALPKSGNPDPVHDPRRVTITIGKGCAILRRCRAGEPRRHAGQAARDAGGWLASWLSSSHSDQWRANTGAGGRAGRAEGGRRAGRLHHHQEAMTAATPERDLADVASPASGGGRHGSVGDLAPDAAASLAGTADGGAEAHPGGALGRRGNAAAPTAAGSHPHARAAPTASASESGGLALAAATASEAAPRGSTLSTPQPHQAVTEEQEKPAPPRPPAETVARTATQAPENHSAEAAYIGRLHAIVARNTVPPSGAAYRLSHPSGEAEVGFTLARDGAVSDVHLIRSSGSALLDKQALAIVAGQRYPGLPDDVYPVAPSHRFSVPVAFTYAGGGDDGP